VMSDNLYPVNLKVDRQQRNKLLGQKALVVWFTGLSGSGKTTLATQLEAELFKHGFKTYLLDGDNIRSGLNKDLTFTEEGRKENIRRIGEVSNLLVDAGIIVLSAFISPFQEDRDKVRALVGDTNFIEVFVDAPLEVCEQRDVKGVYKKARSGMIKNFTGIDSPYEIPAHPDLVIPTHKLGIEESVKKLLGLVLPRISISNLNQ